MQLKTSDIIVPMTPRKRTRAPFIRRLADVKVHVVPCRDCMRLTWVDRGAGIIESVVSSDGAYDEALRALHIFSASLESRWCKRVD